MSQRELRDWLTTYLEYTEDTEPPLSYHTWTALCVISAALQRRCYLRWGHETIYPNLYVVLVGPSGRCRKGTAMNIAKDIVTRVKLTLTSEAITREALIRMMKDSIGSFTDASDGMLKFHSSLFCMSEELSVFLGQNDIQFLSNLTDWYDSRDMWTYRTKGSGVDEIQGVCVVLLGATAPDWIPSMLPQEAIGGGFTSRIIFIVEHDKRKTCPLPIMTPEHEIVRDQLARDLERIINMTGAFQLDHETQQAYSDWYNKQEELIRGGKPPVDDPRFGGYCERRATHARKLAMLSSASRGPSRIITQYDFDRALSLLKSAERTMPNAFGGTGQARHSDVTDRVLRYIMKRREVSRQELMRAFYRDMDSETLHIIESVLGPSGMNVVSVKHDTQQGKVKYAYRGPK